MPHEGYMEETGNLTGQLSIDQCYTPKFVEVNEFSKEKTERGQWGFGSLPAQYCAFSIFSF